MGAFAILNLRLEFRNNEVEPQIFAVFQKSTFARHFPNWEIAQVDFLNSRLSRTGAASALGWTLNAAQSSSFSGTLTRTRIGATSRGYCFRCDQLLRSPRGVVPKGMPPYHGKYFYRRSSREKTCNEHFPRHSLRLDPQRCCRSVFRLWRNATSAGYVTETMGASTVAREEFLPDTSPLRSIGGRRQASAVDLIDVKGTLG